MDGGPPNVRTPQPTIFGKHSGWMCQASQDDSSIAAEPTCPASVGEELQKAEIIRSIWCATGLTSSVIVRAALTIHSSIQIARQPDSHEIIGPSNPDPCCCR